MVDANDSTAPGNAFVLQFTPAQPITLSMGDQTQVIYSAEPTLGSALELAGIDLGPQDAVSLDPNTPLTGPLTVAIRRAQTVTVEVGETTLSGLTAATTVGSALQDLNVPLQNLDYSIPAEDADLPADGKIKVVRVREELLVMTDEVPYSNDYVEDPNTPLDQSSVVVPGQVGIYASRERVRYADGVEVQRDTEPTWQASEAKNGVLGYGTDIVVQTTVVDGVTIEYWRKKTVYATSYKPCNDYTGVCMDGTAGGYPLQKGIIAVMPWWYSVPNGLGMADLSVYIAGYGKAIVGDTCGGCSGDTPWIDLAYREENYVPWHQWTTMYFLTPVPDRYIPAVITP